MRCVETPKYSIRRYQSEDEEKVLNLLSQVLHGWASYPDKRALWRWKHFANPFGPSHVLVACNDSGDIIGALALMRWQFRLGNRLLQSVRVTDSAIHPFYRRLGISTSLRRRLFDIARREGAVLTFSLPNSYALSTSLKSGAQLAGKIRLLLRVLKPRHFVTGLVRSRAKSQCSFQYQPRHFFREEVLPVERFLEHREELTRLLGQDQQFQNKNYRTRRTREYLWWRYGEHPLTHYYTLYREHQGELLGGVIFRTDTYCFLKGIVLNELLLSRVEERLASALLNQLMSILNVDYVLTYFSKDSPHLRSLLKKGFLRLPWPVFNLTVGVWEPDVGERPLNLDNWSLTPGDLEEAWAWR